jgi:hypothetical protein
MYLHLLLRLDFALYMYVRCSISHRIREDTAKYLRNLDLNSAPYDPKSRSMKENPTPHVPPDQAAFLGDNAARFVV